MERIEAYDDELHAILTVNPDARKRADELDAMLKDDKLVEPLHGIPTILKDNQDTEDLPTTGGSVTFEDSTPPDDASVVERMHEAGAVIIAKAGLHELAGSGTTVGTS